MSSAGSIYRETIHKITGTSAGSKSIEFDVENDGFLITIQQVTGIALVETDLFHELPDSMTSIKLGELPNISGPSPEQAAYICGRRGRVDLKWSGTTEIRVSIKTLSGDAVASWNATNTEAEAKAVAETNTSIYQINVLQLLSEMNDSLGRILNHQRAITNIEKDEGQEY